MLYDHISSRESRLRCSLLRHTMSMHDVCINTLLARVTNCCAIQTFQNVVLITVSTKFVIISQIFKSKISLTSTNISMTLTNHVEIHINMIYNSKPSFSVSWCHFLLQEKYPYPSTWLRLLKMHISLLKPSMFEKLSHGQM